MGVGAHCTVCVNVGMVIVMTMSIGETITSTTTMIMTMTSSVVVSITLSSGIAVSVAAGLGSGVNQKGIVCIFVETYMCIHIYLYTWIYTFVNMDMCNGSSWFVWPHCFVCGCFVYGVGHVPRM